tara:strand:+ start:207 stop:854 length:648 start_codon:yes stop_codon:yes gene_type:complete
LVKNDDISVKDLERSETQNIIKKLAVNGVKYEDIMPSSESTTNARDKKEILYNSIININEENSHPIETRRKCRALAKELGLNVDDYEYKYSIESCVQGGFQAEKIIADGKKLCKEEISKNNNESCDNTKQAYKRLAMAAYEKNKEGENIQLSNPGFAVKIHSKGASDLISSHDLGSVGDKMKTRQAVSKQTREKLGQISRNPEPKRKGQAGVRRQ